MIGYIALDFKLTPQDAEDFASDVKLKLIEDDYAKLRAFKGESSLRTFITTVVKHAAIDSSYHYWGRWRPSVAVQRLGDLAIDLDRLLHRDGRTLDETVPILGKKHAGVSRKSLEALAEKLPVYTPRTREVSLDEGTELHVARQPDAEKRLIADELRKTAKTVSKILSAAIKGLSPTDRLILQLRFDSALHLAQIAPMLQLEQKALYGRFDRVKRNLKRDIVRELERAGLTSADMLDLIGHEEVFLPSGFGNSNLWQSIFSDEKTGLLTEES